MNSESPISRDEFEKLIASRPLEAWHCKSLYLHDCRKLVTGIQQCSKEVRFLQGEFYRVLNFEELFFPPLMEPDEVRFMSSPVRTSLLATLNFVFIRLHSLLDYTTKLIYEIEHLATDFSGYPNLSSSKIQFGDHKRLTLHGEPGTVYGTATSFAKIETVRNLVIHDGLLDDMPKVYKVISGETTVEKFVLFPDMTAGRLARFKNRSLFFGAEDKINLRLPTLVRGLMERLTETLRQAVKLLPDHADTPVEAGAESSAK